MRLNRGQLERFIHDNVPLTVAMGLRVVALEAGSIHVVAPLAPNRNDKHTAFGGGLAALAMVTGWGLLHAELAALDQVSDIVIHRGELCYERPVTGDIHVHCTRPEPTSWNTFLTNLTRRGRARVTLTSRVPGLDNAAMSLEGVFVATRMESDQCA